MPKIFVGQSFTVALFSGIEKVWIREGGEHQEFPSKFFCLKVPKISLGAVFTVATISGIEKLWIGGGEYQDFPWKMFCLTVPEKFVVEPFSVSIIPSTEKVWRRERGGGLSRFSVENILSHSVENFRRAILYCYNNFGYREILDKRGGE